MLVAVDTGGTKTLVASFTKDGKMSEPVRFPTPVTPAAYIEFLSDFLIENYSTEDVDAIVIGLPGVVVGEVVIWCNNLHWKHFHAVEALRTALKGSSLAKTPILIENDANLAGLAETRSLKTIPPLSLYVTVSTGIGTGIIENGHISAALSRSEGGRMQIEFKGRVQEWEQFASGQAIVKTYGKYARDIKSKRTWDQIADRISRGMLATIPVLQPDIIVIGGSIGTYFDRYELRLERILHERLPDHIPTPVVVGAKHPEQAVVYGCYYYALDQLATA
jgi:predicted NBD/HSP70 family sugar kinase